MNAEAIRAALRCERPNCACHRPRGPVHCPHPDHPDENPSFSVDQGNGRVLVFCQSRHCPQDEVIEALRARGLWEGKPPTPVLSRLRRGRLEGPLNDVARFIEQYVKMPSDHATTAVALWAAHTWVLDSFDVSPFLIIQSAEKRSGKTRFLEVLELLVPRPWRVVQPSESVLFRKIAQDRPVLLLDEADTIFNPKNNGTEPLRAILNSGNRRGVAVPRCILEGKSFRLVEFSTFCAKVIAGIGSLPGTVEDRGIIIRLDRATPAEQRRIRRFRFAEAETEAAPIREQLARWAESARPRLRAARPAIPEELDGRAADSWEGLLAVAEEAGDGWAVMAWAAALALSAGGAREDDSLGVRLLASIRCAFENRQADRLATTDLIEDLAEDETSPWGDWHGKRITPQAVARLLRPFGVRPGTVREGLSTFKGYKRVDFEDAWSRYLSAPSLQDASDPSHPSQFSIDAPFSHFSDPSHTPLVTDEKNGGNPHGDWIVTDVTDKTPHEWEGEDPGALFPHDDGRGNLPPWHRSDLGYQITPDDGRRQATWRVGESLGFPAVSYRPGHTLLAGRENWERFLAMSPDTEVLALWGALEHLIGGAA